MIQWKKIILSTIAAIGIACFAGGTADAASVKIDEKTFPDVCVRTAVAQYDKNKDGILSDQERDKVTGIDFDSALAQHYTEGHCVDFEGMQNFTDINSIYLDLRYKAKNNSYKYWNYRADNLTQCFPNAQRISIYWYGNQTISLKGTAVNARKISLYALQNGKLDYSLYAPNAQNVEICGKFTDTKKSYGQYFPDASEVILSETNIGGNNTLAGFKGLQTLYLSGKAITSLNFSPLKNNPIYSLSVERAACRSMNLSPLKTCKLKVLSLKDCGVNSLNFQPLATSPLHKLYVINCPLKKIDVSPLKNTLTELWLGTLQNTYFWEEINHKQTKPKYQLLDLSKMKKLKRVYACGVASLKTVKLKDTKTKQCIRSLLELHLYGTGIRTLDATAAKNLKRLFVGDRIRKLTVDKCKKLKEIGMINLGSKQAATIKSSSVQHIQYQGKTLKNLSFSKCPKLYTLSIKCTKVGTVNLRSNKRLHYIQNRIVENGKRGKATWLYIDEFHVLLNSEYSAKYLQQLWKKVRKQGGLCTGITQNVVDLLQNYTATTMLANSEFVALLKQANTDSSKMAEVIGVSEAQLRFVTNTASGMGLIKCGSVVIPFDNQISKDTDLYKLYNTNIHEIIEMKKHANEKC